jgi:UDP-N-acetylglucosamine 2-epimerase
MPVVHVEAGLRSFNRAMPEEVNRVLTDHISDLLFCPSQTAIDNLATEGIKENVHLVGDVMLDVLNWASARANGRAHETMRKAGVAEKDYLLATVHRSENTDDPARLTEILDAFNAIEEDIVFPVHPRTRKVIKEQNRAVRPNIKLVEPLGYFDMVAMTKGARLILTDSGGLQKEAYWLGVPCVTLRDQTEWVETVETGWNLLTGADRERIIDAVRTFTPPAKRPALYGADCVSAKCVEVIEKAGAAASAPQNSKSGKPGFKSARQEALA